MGVLSYLKSLATPGSGNSSKAFALILSAVVGALVGLSVGFAIVYDVVRDGVIDTDLNDLAWFLVSVGVYSFGSGGGKILTDCTFGPDRRKEA